MAEERDLATRLIAGDVDALEQLIERWRGPAERFADSILHDSYAAEDAVQEAFARVWAARTIFDPRYSFSTYLYTIVRRVCIDRIRHEKHEPVPFAELPEIPSASAEEVFLLNDAKLERIHRIAELDETDRRLLLGTALEGMPIRELAKELELSEVYARVRLHRIRKRLKRGLE